MDDEKRSAAAPRWRGRPGRLEVWYATLSDPRTGAGLWVHCETVAPLRGAAYGHGWATWFPPEGPPRTGRFGPVPAHPATGPDWFACAGVRVADEQLRGRAGALAWELSWTDPTRPLWTFPRLAWERAMLPGAQVVLAPTAEFTGRLHLDGAPARVEGWRGGVAHIYGHGNARRWGWMHADLPPERCVSLGYTDPDGGTAVCTNTERADIRVEIDDRRWSVLGHAEVGLRGAEAPAVNERIPA
ncbi:hypothetical protein [Mycobacterium avium]|uniref:hypothetical protein n=1 Tax=Mycobacterium avium TaxID=1764 RepID=UPI00159707F9